VLGIIRVPAERGLCELSAKNPKRETSVESHASQRARRMGHPQVCQRRKWMADPRCERRASGPSFLISAPAERGLFQLSAKIPRGSARGITLFNKRRAGHPSRVHGPPKLL